MLYNLEQRWGWKPELFGRGGDIGGPYDTQGRDGKAGWREANLSRPTFFGTKIDYRKKGCPYSSLSNLEDLVV